MKGLYILKKNKNRGLSLPIDFKTCCQDKLSKTSMILVQRGRHVPIKKSRGFGDSTHICRGTWFIMKETSQINTERINYVVDIVIGTIILSLKNKDKN